MNTRKKAVCLTLACAMCAAVFAAGRTPFSANAEQTDEFQPVVMTEENSEPFLPATREEYLPLQTPSHVAFSEQYTAVADGSTLYLYDKAENEYSYYEHKTGADATATTLSELQFSSDGTLYFTDQSMWLYSLDLQTKTATRQDISCSTFYIAEDYIYYTATVTGTVTFYYVPLATPADPYSTVIRQYSPAANPRLAYENGTLYCVYNHDNLIAFDTQEKAILSESGRLGDRQIAGLQYVCAYKDSLYYTVSGERQGENGLFRAENGAKGTLVLEADRLTTLAVYNGKLYCVQGKSVKEIAVTQESAQFTYYEIAAASSSPNRLSGAVGSARAGNLLVTADKGNHRVSVYDLENGGFSSFPAEHVSLVATDGSTVAATDGDTITVYADGETHAYAVGETLGKIKGIACLFSEVYFVTENNAYGVAGKGHVFYSGYGVPTGMASDLYGKIYVAYHDGSVYAYREEHFTKRGTPEKRAFVLPENHTSLRADFEGNLYCLAENALYKNGAPFALFPEGNPLHFYQGKTMPVSFALGFEDDTVYFNYGDYMLATKKDNEGNAPFPVPTLGKIALEGAKEQIFSTGDAENLLVDVADNAVGIDVDLQRIEQAERYFPYAGYSRTPAMRGVKIAQTQSYTLVLLSGDTEYKALLLRNESVTAVGEQEYLTKEEGVFYLSNAVNACYYPCMEQSLAQNRLNRGTRVNKIAEISLPERQYALVSYGSEHGETLVYVPLHYLSPVDPSGGAGDRYELGFLKAGETTFTGEHGEQLVVTERTAVRLYRQEDGSYTVRFERDGVSYTAENVSANAIEHRSSDALRTSLIVILAVLAALIIGVYIYLLPLRKRKIK
ncbi:MAG: hypothetical protein HFE28_06860 [Clostridia bacterium]|nr:hypothetical protein [Clostridia bacterium]